MKTDSDENGVHLRLTRAEKDLLRALPTGLSPRTGHRREALRQLVAQKWPGPKEAAEAAIGWFDETMSAAHWLSLQDISPDRAAMLLCQHDPNSETVEQARQNTNDATGPDEFVRLVQRFEDLAKCDPRHRSLLDWLQFARASQLRYHPWIDQYVEAAGYLFPPADVVHSPTVPTVAPEVRTAAATSTTHKTKRRANPLAAVLTEAKRRALDATDSASVWAALVELAESDRPAPLLGYVEGEGVKYRSDKEQSSVAYLSYDAFRKRLARAA